MPTVERTRSYGFKMQKGELESLGKSFPLPNGSCEISVAGKNSKRKDPGRCLWEGLGFGAPALGTGVLGPWWEMYPYEMWVRGREEPKNLSSGSPCSSLLLPWKKCVGGGWGARNCGHDEEEKLKVMEKHSCQRLGTAGLGDLLKSPSATHTAILFWYRLMLQACSALGA